MQNFLLDKAWNRVYNSVQSNDEDGSAFPAFREPAAGVRRRTVRTMAHPFGAEDAKAEQVVSSELRSVNAKGVNGLL